MAGAFRNVSICDRSAIVIGDGCGIGRRSVISAKNQIQIEPNTILGPSVSCYGSRNHAFEDVTVPIGQQAMTPGGRIRIEEGCWIGFWSRNHFAVGVNS